MERWSGRVAVVTGASEGIGEALVRLLASSGVRVVALARRKELLEKLENDLNKSNRSVWGHVCDVSNEDQVDETFRWIESNVGAVSILVNNAAYFNYLPLVDMDVAGLKTTMNTNIMGVLYCTHQALGSMKRHSITDGHIVNINSVLGHRDIMMTGVSPYTAAKHALTSLTASLRRELVEAGLKTRVTSVSPGLVDTNMSLWYTKDHPEAPALSAKAVAETILYAISAPANINISELTVEPV